MASTCESVAISYERTGWADRNRWRRDGSAMDSASDSTTWRARARKLSADDASCSRRAASSAASRILHSMMGQEWSREWKAPAHIPCGRQASGVPRPRCLRKACGPMPSAFWKASSWTAPAKQRRGPPPGSPGRAYPRAQGGQVGQPRGLGAVFCRVEWMDEGREQANRPGCRSGRWASRAWPWCRPRGTG